MDIIAKNIIKNPNIDARKIIIFTKAKYINAINPPPIATPNKEKIG